VTPDRPGVVRCRARLPSSEEHALLLLFGWQASPDRKGVYELAGRRVWWTIARDGR